jgi:hypothetical protein
MNTTNKYWVTMTDKDCINNVAAAAHVSITREALGSPLAEEFLKTLRADSLGTSFNITPQNASALLNQVPENQRNKAWKWLKYRTVQ